MGKCAACGQFVVFGGVRQGNATFCNETCVANGAVQGTMGLIPDDLVEEQTRIIHGGPCPECNGAGPVDVYRSHRAYSFIVLTRWTTTPHVCCRRCANGHRWGAIGISALAGWWGVPWGLIATPVQILRNLTSIGGGKRDGSPSDDLRELARASIASRVVEEMQDPPSPAGRRGFEVMPAGSLSAQTTPPPLPSQ